MSGLIEKGPSGGGKLVVLLLCHGITGPTLNDMITDIQSASKNIGTHKRRELYWIAYSKLSNLAQGIVDEKLFGFLTFHLAEGEEDASQGKANFEAFTKRQRGKS